LVLNTIDISDEREKFVKRISYSLHLIQLIPQECKRYDAGHKASFIVMPAAALNGIFPLSEMGI
jgi:hypothetical protein